MQQSLVHNYIQQKQQQVITEAILPRLCPLVRRQFPQQFMRILLLPQMWRNFYGHDSKADLEKPATYYLLILRLQLPSIKGWKALSSVFAISICSPWQTRLNFRWQVDIVNIMPDNAYSVRACEEGNVTLLEAHFNSGQASIPDFTRDYLSLLWVRFLTPLKWRCTLFIIRSTQ